MAESSKVVNVSEDSIKKFGCAVLCAVGVPDDHARAIIENIIDADLRGVESHGIVRLPIYADRLRERGNNPTPAVRIIREGPSNLVLDGDNGMGQWVGEQAMEMAITKAEASGACVFVAVRNSNHYGACAYYTEMACRRNMVGVTFTMGGINHMVPWGGAQGMLGNNPFSIAIPAGEELPVVLDMACSMVARGKIIVAAKRGAAIPEGWAVGPDGSPTTDATQALEGFMQPVGGAKGYALTLMVGLLSSMLSGAAFGSEVTHMYDDLKTAQNVGHLFGVLPIGIFEDVEVFKQRMDKAVQEMRETPKAPGVDRIYLPGEREQLLRFERRQSGIPIPESVFVELQELGSTLGIDLV